MQGQARFAAILAERLAALTSALREPDAREDALTELETLRDALLVFGGTVELQTAEQPLEAWVQASRARLEARAGSCALRIELQDVPPIVFDAARLTEALVELVDNAVHAGAKTIALRISTQQRRADELPPELAPGAYLRLALSDDGKGMARGLRRRAVWPSVSEWKRAGLGLARVQGIVTAHGGQLLFSEPEVGSGSGCIAAVELPWRAAKVETPTAASGPRRTVLVVDDEPLAIRAISRVLRGRDFELLLASGATAALDLLVDAKQLDVLVTDVNMPGMGGFQLAQRVREAFPQVRLLFISGFPPDSLEGVPQPCEILAKPFSHRELLGALEPLLVSGATE